MNRYETVLRWFEEYGWKVIKKSKYGSADWHETIIENKKGVQRTFEITNNHIWLIRGGRTSLGKTKTELYMNLKRFD